MILMKVYEVIFDANHYQALLPEDEDIWRTGMLRFDGTPRASYWNPPTVFCLYPKLKEGNFITLGPGKIGTAPETIETVRTFFEIAGEILPLPYQGREYSIFNMTECINCLDADRSQWLITESGERALLKKPVFYPNRFTVSSIFSIPEKCRGNWFALERYGDPEEEFKACVETEGLTGLIFKEVWSS